MGGAEAHSPLDPLPSASISRGYRFVNNFFSISENFYSVMSSPVRMAVFFWTLTSASILVVR